MLVDLSDRILFGRSTGKWSDYLRDKVLDRDRNRMG